MKPHEGGTLEGPGAPLSVVGTWSAGCQQWAPVDRMPVERCDLCGYSFLTHIYHPLTGMLEPDPDACACPPDWARNRAERQNLGRQNVRRTPDGRVWGPGAIWKPLDRAPR